MIEMFNYLRKISLGNWILIAMVLGILTGVFLNFYVENQFIKNFILMFNVSVMDSLTVFSNRNYHNTSIKSVFIFFLK